MIEITHINDGSLGSWEYKGIIRLKNLKTAALSSFFMVRGGLPSPHVSHIQGKGKGEDKLLFFLRKVFVSLFHTSSSQNLGRSWMAMCNVWLDDHVSSWDFCYYRRSGGELLAFVSATGGCLDKKTKIVITAIFMTSWSLYNLSHLIFLTVW